MNFGASLILAGLCAEILGGLVLSIDAIGLDRVKKWSERMTTIGRQATGREPAPRDSITRPGINRLLVAFCAPLGAMVVLYFFLPERTEALTMPWWKYILIVLGGGIAGPVAYFAVAYAILGVTTLLVFAEQRAERKTAGIVGFGALLIGFVLQFSGTLVDALRH
jgi:drug/metabolite transporter (DMT)-like permease